jgi:uncharacterized membrane protein
MTLYVFFVFLHVLAAILAFGTAMLAFPIIGAFADKEPKHLNFALRLNYLLGRRAVTPLALATFGFGIVLILLGNWNLFETEWLWISTLLFLITVADAQLVTLPAVRRLVELTTAAADDTATASHPEVRRLFRKVKIGGSLSAVLLVIITLLMIWKPGS